MLFALMLKNSIDVFVRECSDKAADRKAEVGFFSRRFTRPCFQDLLDVWEIRWVPHGSQPKRARQQTACYAICAAICWSPLTTQTASKMAPTTWKTYFGEAPDAHSSDDDDYHDGKAHGYTRAEARDRDRKWADIKAFEAARTLTVVNKADHRGLCMSVRPVDGAEAVVSYEVRDKGDTLLKQVKRQVVTVGANDAQLDDVLRELRRGERAPPLLPRHHRFGSGDLCIVAPGTMGGCGAAEGTILKTGPRHVDVVLSSAQQADESTCLLYTSPSPRD